MNIFKNFEKHIQKSRNNFVQDSRFTKKAINHGGGGGGGEKHFKRSLKTPVLIGLKLQQKFIVAEEQPFAWVLGNSVWQNSDISSQFPRLTNY